HNTMPQGGAVSIKDETQKKGWTHHWIASGKPSQRRNTQKAVFFYCTAAIVFLLVADGSR
ncbi:MAG: hypothetical protein RR280_07600, partial [Bacteroidaceae bacterium]